MVTLSNVLIPYFILLSRNINAICAVYVTSVQGEAFGVMYIVVKKWESDLISITGQGFLYFTEDF